VSGVSAASGFRNGQFDRKRDFIQLCGVSFEDKKANIEQ
jgi:hypothetical protein